MAKILIIVGFVAACGFMGTLKAGELKERITLLEDFRMMIIYMKGKINYFRQPLTTMTEKESQYEHSRAFKLLGETGSALGQKNDDMSQIWAQEATRIYKNTPLTAEDMELIRYPGCFLGQTDWQNQQASFEYLEHRLSEQIKQAGQAYAAKGPLYRKIGFFAGGLIAIIFL